LNQLLSDQPQPEIARSAVILGEVHVGADAILAQGLVVRAHGAAVSIGNYSARRDRVRRQRDRGRIGGPRRSLRQAARPFR
jgi:carbonic anhydrase/acetyltransferase-like protein (isoleucine patch superfamily)